MLLASSFIIGLGMAMLQTVLNPLQRVVGGEENYAFVAEVAQFVFGIASFLSPLVYTYLIHELNPDIYTEGRNFSSTCWQVSPRPTCLGIALLGIHVAVAGDAGCRRAVPFPENRVERR